MSLPPHDPLLNARRTGYTRSGFGARYHAHRPKPPAALVDVLLQLAGTRRPRLVVDLGSGTDISTMLWAPHAERVVGVEPLDEMRKIAEAGNASANVSFASVKMSLMSCNKLADCETFGSPERAASSLVPRPSQTLPPSVAVSRLKIIGAFKSVLCRRRQIEQQPAGS